ncbi:MAG: substrate-binding domain-containing protein [Lachnospiraceae bacterium]|nr:substrate-binding domain-containing protein [Lachnospiraceae bacterium]
MKSKGIRLVLLLFLLLCVLTGCGKRDEETEDTMADEEKIQIGISFDSFVMERWQRDRDIFVSKAKELGAEVNVQNANGDPKEQIAQIEYFIEKKMDVILIVSIEYEGLQDVIKRAQAQGIKIISYDRMIKNAGVDLHISFDNKKVGSLMAEAIYKENPNAKKVWMLCGPTTDNNVSLVEKGFRKVMREKNIKIEEIMYADGWHSEHASSYIYEHSDRVGEVDGIMCGNDSLATATIHALSEQRLAGIIPVVGQDADLEACQRIVEGTQIMTVYKPVEKLAQTAAEYAVMLAQGKELPKTERVFDGVYQVPYVVLDPIAVTKENMDEVIIGSGFHSKDEVYLNMPETKTP